MKRPIIMAIALAFSMSLAACGSNAPVLSENNISSQQTSSPAQSTEDLAPEMIAGTLYAVIVKMKSEFHFYDEEQRRFSCAAPFGRIWGSSMYFTVLAATAIT